MIYINKNKIEMTINADWQENAKVHSLKISELENSDRSKYIRKHPLWTEIKEGLATIRNYKCWYCENDDTRSDHHIDHFRPANSVRESDDHPGYWWLAYDPLNYRYSCAFCNSPHGKKKEGTDGGKHDHFPLDNPEDRAKTPACDLTAERPTLLDPIDPFDYKLLWFNIDGEAVSRYSAEEDPNAYRRVRESIKIYHLNFKRLPEKRKKVALQVKRLIKQGDKFVDDPVHEIEFKEIMCDLINMMSEDTVFSSAATSYILNHKAKPWVKDMITR